MWAIGVSIPLFLFWHDLRIVKHGSLDGLAFWGRDFVILWSAGQLVYQGAISTIYNLHAFQATMAALFGSLEPMGYPYPPVTFPIAFAFGLLPYWLAQPLWFAVTGALFLYACRRYWTPAMGPRWLAVVTPAALMNIWAGHYGFLHGIVPAGLEPRRAAAEIRWVLIRLHADQTAHRGPCPYRPAFAPIVDADNQRGFDDAPPHRGNLPAVRLGGMAELHLEHGRPAGRIDRRKRRLLHFHVDFDDFSGLSDDGAAMRWL